MAIERGLGHFATDIVSTSQSVLLELVTILGVYGARDDDCHGPDVHAAAPHLGVALTGDR